MVCDVNVAPLRGGSDAREAMTNAVLIILARDEGAVIGATVQAAKAALRTGDALYVVADHCSDDTASQARRAGAQVVVRETGLPAGKGAALAWFLETHRQALRPYALVVILDADSLIPADFLAGVKAHAAAGEAVFQCFISPLYAQDAAIGALAALSELLDQRLSDRLRARLGWPVRLRGTGMVFATPTLMEVAGQVATKVEDTALSLLLTARRIPIRRIESAIVFDPKPGTAAAAMRQRARWFRGQWQALWVYRRQVLQILAMGPPGWSLLGSLFLKPKWLLLTFSLLAALVFREIPWLAFAFWFFLALGLFYFVVGLILLPERMLFLWALRHAPLYIWMWLRGILLSLRKSFWLRARK